MSVRHWAAAATWTYTSARQGQMCIYYYWQVANYVLQLQLILTVTLSVQTIITAICSMCTLIIIAPQSLCVYTCIQV